MFYIEMTNGVVLSKLFQVVILWDLHDYSCKKTVMTYETLEAVSVIFSSSLFASSLGLQNCHTGKKIASNGIYFITVGERGVVRIWNSER